jgi:hypothetical protein
MAEGNSNKTTSEISSSSPIDNTHLPTTSADHDHEWQQQQQQQQQ